MLHSMTDPQIDPRLIIEVGLALADDPDLSELVPALEIQRAIAAFLRAAREAGADAVTVDGGLVRIMSGIEADAEYPHGGPDGTEWHMAVVPLDGGDDGE